MITILLLISCFLNNPTDDYYVVVMAYQNATGILEPAETHTFAFWVRMRDGKVLEDVVINWCPVNMSMRVVAAAVPGKNATIRESLDIVEKEKKRVSSWIMRTDLSYFESAKKQRDALSQYKLFDKRSRPMAVNCIHAITDTAGFLETGTACGLEAGQIIAEHMIRNQKAWKTSDVTVDSVVSELIANETK